MKRRRPTTEELALWRRAMRGTTPLPGRADETDGETETAEPSVSFRSQPPPPANRKPVSPGAFRPSEPDRPPPPPGGVDAATRRKLRRGRAPVEGRVDLHGMRRAEAHLALTRFIAESQLAGRRCVLVITGKGGRLSAEGDAAFMQRSEEGVLRRQVPLWLAQEPIASRVFAVEQAHPRHGGSGAFYVFLRRLQGRDDNT